MVKYDFKFITFMLGIQIKKLPESISDFVKTIKIDNSSTGFTKVYYRTNAGFIYTNPPDLIKEGSYCSNCSQLGPKHHHQECFDPINGNYLTVGGIIKISENFNDYFYTEGNSIYEKQSGDLIVKDITKADKSKKTDYKIDQPVDDYPLKDKIILKHCIEGPTGNETCNLITISPKNISILANPFHDPEFYKKLLDHLGISKSLIKEISISSIFANLTFFRSYLKSDEIVSTIVNQQIFGPEFGDYEISNKNNIQILKMNKYIDGYIEAKYTLQFRVSSIQIVLHQFLSKYSGYDVLKQIQKIEYLTKHVVDALTDTIVNNKQYNIIEKEINLKYHTINNNLPYAKSAITNMNSLRKGVEGASVLLYNPEEERWNTEESFTIDSFIDRENIIIKNKQGNKLSVNVNMIKLENIKGRGNQVCRDIQGNCRHHPVPYSFYGACPTFGETINPVGTQSSDDNHFYPCCKDSDIRSTMLFIMNGLTKTDMRNGLIDPNAGYDKFSGLFKQGTFERPFEAIDPKTGSYILVQLIEILTKDQDKFVVQSIQDPEYIFNINYNQINPKYRENRSFIGVNNMFKTDSERYAFIYNSLVEGGILPDSLDLNIEKQVVDTVPRVHYLSMKNKNVLNKVEKVFIVPKYSIFFTMHVNNKTVYITDSYYRNYILIENLPDYVSSEIKDNYYGFYRNSTLYFIGSDSGSASGSGSAFPHPYVINFGAEKGLHFKLALEKDINDSNFFVEIANTRSTDGMVLGENVDIIFAVRTGGPRSEQSPLLYKWTKINSFSDSTLVLKLNEETRKVLSGVLKMKKIPESDSYLKLTFDIFDKFKIIDKLDIDEKYYYTFKVPNEYEKLLSILFYFNFYDTFSRI
jgi:hypothetical protein